MGFIVREKYVRVKAREKLRMAFTLIGHATERELTIIDDMDKFYKKNKYLSISQLSYLGNIVCELTRKSENARFRAC